MGGGGGHSHSPLDVIDSLTTSQHKVVHFLSGFFTASSTNIWKLCFTFDLLSKFFFFQAKIMYYYETLSSIDYRGSMTSLQSCQSAFSNISKLSLKNQHNKDHKTRHNDDQHSMTSGISSGGISQSTDGGGGEKRLEKYTLQVGGEQSFSSSVIPAVTVLPPTSPGTPTATILATPIASSNSESSTVQTLSGSSEGSTTNNEVK